MEYKQEIQSLVKEIRAQGYVAICFWLPAYNTGGGTFYFCEMAKYLACNTDLKIYYMDYPEGYPSRLLKGSDVKVLTYRIEDSVFPVEDKCVVITNSTRAIQLTRMRPDNKLLFWHYETVPCAWDVVFIMDEKHSYLDLCRRKRAMMFHDWSAWDVLSEDCGTDYEKKYLPLYLNEREPHASTELIREGEINIGWLGRLAVEKNYSLFNIIDNLANYQTDRKKILHIIGDGPLKQDVVEYIKKYQKIIDFRMTGIIPQNKLGEYLIKNIDVLFAMGLSVLEGAARRIPSVVVKLDTKRITGDEFIWLFNSMEYCVGILPTQRDRFPARYCTLENIMDAVYEQNGRGQLGEDCYNYYMKNHSSEEFAVYQILSSIQSDEMTMADLEGCIKYIPYSHVRVKRKTLMGKTISKRVIFEDVEKEKQ